ncbi:DUF3179 domain-containing protein [Candidatus Kaiserbacteria bacterium]|nr:DUF3179 domain-containing protein [Candidatus Kaiserbacteria bacterium]
MYGRDVQGKTLTFAVSGQLWNASLVMIDLETRSLWSHILGECVHGPLKGEKLPQLIADTMTWKAWRNEHPDTTVLNLSRSSKDYGAEFYTKPERFAYGFVVDGKHFHATFATLRESPVQNLTLNGQRLLLTFDPESTAARLFSRRLDDRVLAFVAADNGLIRDEQTGSMWNRTRGIAVAGPLKGKQLDHEPAIITLTRKWTLFHEDSTEILEKQQP